MVLSGYAFVPNIRKKLTPDIKRPGKSGIIFIDLSNGKRRLGASAFSHVHGQLGDECPDLEDASLLKKAFDAVQSLIEQDIALSYHDLSEGIHLFVSKSSIGMLILFCRWFAYCLDRNGYGWKLRFGYLFFQSKTFTVCILFCGRTWYAD